MVDIARALVNGQLGTVGGSEDSEPRTQQGLEEDPVLQRHFKMHAARGIQEKLLLRPVGKRGGPFPYAGEQICLFDLLTFLCFCPSRFLFFSNGCFFSTTIIVMLTYTSLPPA